MLVGEDQGEPTNQGEEVCQEVLGAIQVVLIEQTEAAKPETRWRYPGERSQRLN
jgi:hypothetical protein